MKCILSGCLHPPHKKGAGGCALLGNCGAAVALEAARQPGGYEVCGGENPTIQALEHAGLVTTHDIPGTKHWLVRAVKTMSAISRRAKRKAA